MYNEILDVWMMPCPYPYGLENFQQAYDNLKAGKSAQVLTRSQAAEFAGEEELKPTHYALKIYPKNEDEQWEVEMMQDVAVLYIPFDYVQLTPQEVEKVTQTRSTFNTFTEKSPYTVTYDYTDATDGGPTEPVTYQIPILYTVWPVDKPLPDDLEYEIDHEIFQPRDAATQIGNSETLMILANEAVSAARGVPARTLTTTTSPATRYYGDYLTLYANVKSYDGVMGSNIPMPNLKVQYTVEEGAVGGWLSGTTIRDGSIAIETRIPYMTSGSEWYEIESFMVYYQDPAGKWKITTGNSTAPHSISMWVTLPAGRNAVLYPSEIIVPQRDRQANQIWRAANYFFNTQTDIPNQPGNTLRIIANNYSDPNAKGSFSPYSCTINIYNNGHPQGDVIGTTLHELGHFTHCYQTQSIYHNSHPFLQESFASYVGWYPGEEYYKSLGWKQPDGLLTVGQVQPYVDDYNVNVTGQCRQDWTKEYNAISNGINIGWYSPLFIDMTDQIDQSAYFKYNYYSPGDPISGISPSMIWSIISTSQSWAQCRQKITNVVGSRPGFSGWIDNFDKSPANK